MDLRSIINNNNEAGDSSSSKQTAPVTPIHDGPPQQGVREYSHPPHASPGKHPSQSLEHDSISPSTYQASYSGRPPPPPPIQAPPQNDLRSPAGSYSAQSPYRQTPTSSMSGGQYPFPQTHQTPQSPAQHHQYPPSYRRDSFSQSNPPPPHLQHPNSHTQPSAAPQTPPIGIPGQPHPYLQHQRSHSSLSTSTPTSAQSQQQYYSQYPQDSPIITAHFPPSQPPRNQRQQSLPGTPLGPPISQRQSSGGFPQPTSPYQQRGVPSGPLAQYQQTSPAPPPPASIPRLPSTPSGYDLQRTSTSELQRRSQSERERSISISPKTRLLSQSPGNPPQQRSPYETSVKRKMDDLENSVEQPRHLEQPGVKPHVNDEHRLAQPVTSSPQQPVRKRIRYTELPIWARSARSKGNFTVAGSRMISKVNGKQTAAQPQTQTTPPVVKSETNGHQQTSGAVNQPGPASNGAVDDPSILLGPWEKSIQGNKPHDAIAKAVADWLLFNVVLRQDIGELTSRGVEVEIEAKLGQLFDKDTGVRYQLPVTTEVMLREINRVQFTSSMTETQHKTMNDFLNDKVTETHPKNPGAKRRVPIAYLHRRERDSFYDLPPAYQARLPPAVQEQLKKTRHTPKLRVTHDQKTNRIIAKIVKARVADLDIMFPGSPLDCRISINFEIRLDGDVEDFMDGSVESRQPDRMKDRLSYTQSHYQIDLTQVTQVTSVNGVNRTEKEHELEIELSTAALRDQGQRALAGQQNEYLTLVEGLIDNVRVLARHVPVEN